MTSAESAEPARSWNRLDGVDLLRGLAILFVLMNHVNMRLLSADVPYTKALPVQLVSSLVWNGQRGVQIFFAVSGGILILTFYALSLFEDTEKKKGKKKEDGEP